MLVVVSFERCCFVFGYIWTSGDKENRCFMHRQKKKSPLAQSIGRGVPGDYAIHSKLSFIKKMHI